MCQIESYLHRMIEFETWADPTNRSSTKAFSEPPVFVQYSEERRRRHGRLSINNPSLVVRSLPNSAKASSTIVLTQVLAEPCHNGRQ